MLHRAEIAARRDLVVQRGVLRRRCRRVWLPFEEHPRFLTDDAKRERWQEDDARRLDVRQSAARRVSRSSNHALVDGFAIFGATFIVSTPAGEKPRSR